jgi:hypothetical protein
MVTVPDLVLAATITFGGAVFFGEPLHLSSTFHTKNGVIDQYSALNMSKYILTSSGATSSRER